MEQTSPDVFFLESKMQRHLGKFIRNLKKHIIFLYHCKLSRTPSSVLILTEKIRTTCYIEHAITRENIINFDDSITKSRPDSHFSHLDHLDL